MGPNHSKSEVSFSPASLFFYNYWENLLEDRKKVIYSTSFLIGRAAKWIEPYLFKLTNKDPAYLVNHWALFQSQLFTLFGEPTKAIKAEAELDCLRKKEGGNLCLYISDFRVLISRIGDWGESALIHHFRNGLASRILD
ncbi:hypothetical protein O181_050093 [Austropuccinia psidii MF-1]|uniref:Retrotransposon gag domain-containing protein n=1 Tax=Austropuccinia psidii MF-1 TaxID=1389203 RepID=A0A9Q3DYM5_9BASI|nr:hypothetical protein [Austropuccinia psidii MF-1]